MTDADALNAAYRERAHLLAWIAAAYPAVITPAPDVDEPDWQILYIDASGHQLSWHIAPADAPLFAHVEHVSADDSRAQWDGHTTAEKYERIIGLISDLSRTHGPAPTDVRPVSHRGERPIGDVLDALGITADIGEGTLVASAVVLLKSVLDNGHVRLSLSHSDGLSWIERAGMIRLADAMEAAAVVEATEPGA